MRWKDLNLVFDENASLSKKVSFYVSSESFLKFDTAHFGIVLEKKIFLNFLLENFFFYHTSINIPKCAESNFKKLPG